MLLKAPDASNHGFLWIVLPDGARRPAEASATMKIPLPQPDDDLLAESLWNPDAHPKDPLVAWMEAKLEPRRMRAAKGSARVAARWALVAALATAAVLVLWQWLGRSPQPQRAPVQEAPIAMPGDVREVPASIAADALAEPAEPAPSTR